jgi:hypothetical protein
MTFCPAHHVWQEVQRRVAEVLRSATIGALAAGTAGVPHADALRPAPTGMRATAPRRRASAPGVPARTCAATTDCPRERGDGRSLAARAGFAAQDSAINEEWTDGGPAREDRAASRR